jgi:hypothetical protein
MSRVLLSTGARRALPSRMPSPSGVVFLLPSARRLSKAGGLAGLSRPGVPQQSEAADIDCRHLVRRRLKDVAIVMDLREFAPAGGRATSG